jgi:K+-transporting ATPase ATPase B chain
MTVPSHVRRLDASEPDHEGPIDRLAFEVVLTSSLRVGDFVLCTAGDVVPADGVIVEGIASRDEEPGTHTAAKYLTLTARQCVRRGTRIVCGYIVVRVTDSP